MKRSEVWVGQVVSVNVGGYGRRPGLVVSYDGLDCGVEMVLSGRLVGRSAAALHAVRQGPHPHGWAYPSWWPQGPGGVVS